MFPLHTVTDWQSRRYAQVMLRVAGSALRQLPYSTACPLQSRALGPRPALSGAAAAASRGAPA